MTRREEMESLGGGFVSYEKMMAMAREWDVRGGDGEDQIHRLIDVLHIRPIIHAR